MENIRSTSDLETTILPASRSSESDQESQELGAFDGLTVTQAEHNKEFLPLKMERRGDSTSPEDTSMHSFAQVYPSTSSLETNSSPSPSLDSPVSHEEDFSDLRKGIKTRAALLETKISIAQKALSSLQKESRFYECQERYIKNLQNILQAIDIPPTFYREHQEEIPTIESAIDSMIDVAEELTSYHKELITDQLAGKQREHTGAIGEATQSLCHYLDFVEMIKAGMKEKSVIDCCLAKKCFSIFKALNAREHHEEKELELFQKASFCYSEALSRQSFSEHSLVKAGDSFFYAATMLQVKQKRFSKLYEQAAISFQKGNKQSMAEATIIKMNDENISANWIFSGMQKLNAITQLSKKNDALFKLYNMSSKYFQYVAEKLLSAVSSKDFHEITSLRQAASYFASAAEAKEEGDEEISSLYELLGLCYRQNQKAIAKDNSEAITYFELAQQTLLESLDSLSKEEKKPPSIKLAKKYSYSLAHSYYMAGRSFLKSAADASNLYLQTAECYSTLIQEEKNGRNDTDPVIQLFRAAAKYSEIAAQESEFSSTDNETVCTSLGAAALNLKIAAEALQGGDQELADAYERCATSHFYLAVANKPSLVEHLPLALRLGFQKESTPSRGIRAYWEKVTIENHQKIVDLLAVRNSEQSYRKEYLEDKGSVI